MVEASNNGRSCTVSYWIIRNWKVIQVQGHIFQIADVEVGAALAGWIISRAQHLNPISDIRSGIN